MDASELMKRTRAAIERQMGDYYLFEIDKNPVGCVALHPHPETQQGELAFLYVSPSHENQGIGSKLVQFVEARARELGITDLFTLSTTAFTWFQNKAGYAEATPDVLPIARRERYEASGRNSKILVKRLRPETGTIPLGGSDCEADASASQGLSERVPAPVRDNERRTKDLRRRSSQQDRPRPDSSRVSSAWTSSWSRDAAPRRGAARSSPTPS
jgi:N-acetylglutamate synthase-like GNAT family acetyltransferase